MSDIYSDQDDRLYRLGSWEQFRKSLLPAHVQLLSLIVVRGSITMKQIRLVFGIKSVRDCGIINAIESRLRKAHYRSGNLWRLSQGADGSVCYSPGRLLQEHWDGPRVDHRELTTSVPDLLT